MKLITITAITASLFALAACERVTEQSIHQNAQAASYNMTVDERNLYKSLDDTQRARAILFLQNGGTVAASLGDM
ncbi:MAG: hypothetical protein V3V13_09005 [Paracoccaceae bacterium]